MIAAYEIAEEFFTNSRRLDDAQRAWVLARGISPSAIETDPYCASGPLRFASVVFGERYFDFAVEGDPSALPAFIVIARDQFGVTDDLVAFDGRGRLAPGLGRARLLGEQMILAPRLGEPLRVFEDVWAWLRANRDGVVILDWRVAARRLEEVSLCVDSVEFGQILRERLARPAPPIFVKITGGLRKVRRSIQGASLSAKPLLNAVSPNKGRDLSNLSQTFSLRRADFALFGDPELVPENWLAGRRQSF